jgi:hypothetical protein
MLRRKAMFLSAFFLASPLLARTQTEKPAAPPPTPDKPTPPPEFERMRALLSQMQNNLASLPSGYSAEKHQFELQNDMWRMMLDHIENSQGPRANPAR